MSREKAETAGQLVGFGAGELTENMKTTADLLLKGDIAGAVVSFEHTLRWTKYTLYWMRRWERWQKDADSSLPRAVLERRKKVAAQLRKARNKST